MWLGATTGFGGEDDMAHTMSFLSKEGSEVVKILWCRQGLVVCSIGESLYTTCP